MYSRKAPTCREGEQLFVLWKISISRIFRINLLSMCVKSSEYFSKEKFSDSQSKHVLLFVLTFSRWNITILNTFLNIVYSASIIDHYNAANLMDVSSNFKKKSLTREKFLLYLSVSYVIFLSIRKESLPHRLRYNNR